jgi:hypothetical protein
MSAIFFLTTGEFLALFKGPAPTEEQEQQLLQQQQAAAAEAAQRPPTEATQLLGMKPHPIPHHGIPTPAGAAGAAWQPHHMGSPSRRLSSSLFDEEPLLRRLSLIVPKDEADTACCELEQHAASAGGGGHVHPNHSHHAHHRPPEGSRDGANGSGSAGGGGAAYATVI